MVRLELPAINRALCRVHPGDFNPLHLDADFAAENALRKAESHTGPMSLGRWSGRLLRATFRVMPPCPARRKSLLRPRSRRCALSLRGAFAFGPI